MLQRPERLEPFLRGCAFPAHGDVAYPRVDFATVGDRLPRDTLTAAAIPAGVRFEWVGAASRVEIDYETATRELGYRGEGAGTEFALYRGGALVSHARAELGRARIALDTGVGAHGAATPAILYLPEGMKPLVHAIEPVGGAIEPAPRAPRWLCYGDSIAEGWSASGPALGWPVVAARRFGLDVVNLGYAGSARGEIPAAEMLGALEADAISITYGTNCWNRTPHGEALFAAQLDAFLEIVRQGHPTTPIVAVSPIVRPDAEGTKNRLGATLADLRRAFERVVAERIAGGDARLVLLRGEPLVAAAQLVDGIHPGDEGHAAMADAIGAAVARALA